jgi:signal transduction histidine kinase
MNLGNIYLYHGEYNKALLEYNKALAILNEYPGKRISTRASLLTNMGICFKANHEPDTALVYYEKALEIRKKIGPSRSVSGLYDNIGNLLKSRGEYDNALSYYNKALAIRKKGAGARDLASSYGNIGLLYVTTNENKKAISYLNKALEISRNMHFVEISINCKQGLSEAYKNMGNYKYALEYYVEYQELNDSIHSLKLEEKLNDYKQKYESEKKDRLIERLEEDKKLADALDKRQKVINEKQRMMMNGLGGIALLLLVILFILQRYFKMKRESDRKLFEKTEQLNQQKTLELMKELEMSSFKSFIEGQEKERTRIAGDLHDRLGSLLSTVRLHFDSLDDALSENPEAKQSHEFALKLLDSSVQEVRAVSRNLTKGVLTQFGLIAAVENMRDAINAAGKIQMEVLSSGVTSRLNPNVEINLFRVIQELITNVIRHAQTNEVFVQFNGAGNHFGVIVEDHGIGFDKNNIESNGIGMSNLKSRIQAVGGSFDIDSIIGQGTTIIIDVPYNTEAEKEGNEDNE